MFVQVDFLQERTSERERDDSPHSDLSSNSNDGKRLSIVLSSRCHFDRLFSLSNNILLHLDLSKLCYDFTCMHSGVCTSNAADSGPKCDCFDTGYTGERCDKRKSKKIKRKKHVVVVCLLVPNGFYFGGNNAIGSLIYQMNQSRQTEHDTITFGLQTLAGSAQIFRLESDIKSYSLEYEIVC